jgi:hypothetical protein
MPSVTINITEDELKELKRDAKDVNMSIDEYCKYLLVKFPAESSITLISMMEDMKKTKDKPKIDIISG